MIRHAVRIGALGIVLGGSFFTTPPEAQAGSYASMDEVPVTQGELRLVKAGEMEMVVEAEGTAPAFAFPLRHTDVKVDISGVMANVVVEQTFENPFKDPIEAVYVFPLGDDAAVHDYEIVIGDRTIKGVIKRKAEARETYEKAKREGKTAALLEQEKPNIFMQSVTNIPPGEDVKVRITYVELLEYADHTFEFVFPMVVGPRYLPKHTADPRPVGAHVHGKKAPVGVTSIPYLSPGERSGHDIDVSVRVDAGVPLTAMHSSSHQIQAIDNADTTESAVQVQLAQGDKIPNKDFVLRYSGANEKTMIGWLTHREEEDGFFTLMVQPKREYRVGDITKREVVILIDRSGSMSGAPIEQTRKAARAIINTLSERDSLNIVGFAGGVSTWQSRPVTATASAKADAIQYVNRIQSGGGTEMLMGVVRALKRPPGSDQVRMVYVMTDGYIGNDGEILHQVQKRGGHNRIYPIGVGNSPNRYLLDRLGEIGRGFTSYINLNESADEVSTTLVKKTTMPYLTDVTIDWGGLEVTDVTPEIIPDVYAGQPIVLSGRYKKPGKGRIKINARVAGQDVSTPLTVTLPDREVREGVRYLWARRRIHELMNTNFMGNNKDAESQVTELGLAFHLVTNYTSFVAVDETRVVDAKGMVKTIVQPVEIPAGVQFDGVFGNGQQQPTNLATGQSYTQTSGTMQNMPVSRKRSRRSWGGGGGAVDPVTITAMLMLLPAAHALRRRRRRREDEEASGQ